MGNTFFNFKGRIGRRTFWLAVLALVGIIIALLVVAGAILGVPGPDYNPLTSRHPFAAAANAISLLILWPALAVAVKRLHDRNRSSWWLTAYYSLAFIPFAVTMGPMVGVPIIAPGGVFALIMLAVSAAILLASIWLIIETGFLRGTPGPNRFGPDPLGGIAAVGTPPAGRDWAD